VDDLGRKQKTPATTSKIGGGALWREKKSRISPVEQLPTKEKTAPGDNPRAVIK
jgi:hypothetical protein